MASTNVSVFDRTVQKTQKWLDEIVEQGPFEDAEQAYTGLRAVLHALRDRLVPGEAMNLGAQLPMLVRGFYFEGWKPDQTPTRERDPDSFVEHVRGELAGTTVDPAAAIQAVFGLLERKVTAGEIEEVKHMLPREILETFWRKS